MTNSSPNPSSSDEINTEQPFVSHLVELRDRILHMLLAVMVCFLCLFAFANDLYTLFSEPLIAVMPENSQMIAIDVASPFFAPFKLTMVLSVFMAIPYILYQLWSFIAPGLYSHEKKLVVPLLFSSTVLFYSGAAFAYFVVFPLVFGFFASVTPEGVTMMTDISRYLDFMFTLFFAFGCAFEVPIATVILVWMGITTPEKLREKRAFVVVGAFVIGMLLTPPDIISQTLLAIPMWILFEIGVFFSQWMPSRENSDDESHQPLTDSEMESELDKIEKEESGL